VIGLLRIVLRLLADLAGLIALLVRPRRAIEAENLVLRRQLALFKERGVKPRRIDAATRASLVLLSRWCDWRSCLVVVRPETVLRWHRAGWRLFWRCKSRPGRPPIPLDLRQLIWRMATENPLWGEERIANELLLKLSLRVSPRTVRKYMPKRLPGRLRGDQRWSTFLGNHARAIVACDFTEGKAIGRHTALGTRRDGSNPHSKARRKPPNDGQSGEITPPAWRLDEHQTLHSLTDPDIQHLRRDEWIATFDGKRHLIVTAHRDQPIPLDRIAGTIPAGTLAKAIDRFKARAEQIRSSEVAKTQGSVSASGTAARVSSHDTKAAPYPGAPVQGGGRFLPPDQTGARSETRKPAIDADELRRRRPLRTEWVFDVATNTLSSLKSGRSYAPAQYSRPEGTMPGFWIGAGTFVGNDLTRSK
jgi:hypothetical protein